MIEKETIGKTREVILTKVRFFIKTNTAVHINLDDKRFFNGNIEWGTETEGEDVIYIIDRVLGRKLIFIDEIFDINPYQTKEEMGWEVKENEK